jgi:hypothetical protein
MSPAQLAGNLTLLAGDLALVAGNLTLYAGNLARQAGNLSISPAVLGELEALRNAVRPDPAFSFNCSVAARRLLRRPVCDGAC